MPTSGESNAGFLSLLQARKRWILVVSGLVLLSAVVFSLLQTPTYKSQAQVLVQSRPATVGSTREPDMNTEKQVAMSARVAEVAGRRLGLSPEHASRGLSVTVPVETATLVLSYAHARPEEARRRAQTFAESYIEVRSGRQAAGPGPPGPLPGGLWTYDMIASANLPTAPSSPNYAVNLTVALAVGLALGIGSALVRDHLDDRVRGAADLAAHTKAPVLAVVPQIHADTNDASRLLVTLRTPTGPAAEAYHNLCRKVLQAAADHGATTIVVTSPSSGEGKTTTAANLSFALALSGKRVTLVCADLYRPRLHEVFALPNDVGLVSVLGGQARLEEALQETGFARLRLLPGTSVSSYSALLSPSWLLAETFVKDLLGELSADADLVVIDSAPLLRAPGTLSLVKVADVTLLVADGRRSTRRLLDEARSELSGVGANLIGTVLNNAVANSTLPSYAFDDPGRGAPAPRRRWAPWR